jgi:ubiquinone/menaquinone biosynthesis C-methylase UbiE
MKINTNTWNKIRYTIYSPFYDILVGYFANTRKKSIESLEIKPGNEVLLLGAGTGLDLNVIPKGCNITAIDITPAMIEKVKKRNQKLNHNLNAIVMDGQALKFSDNYFDKIVLHFILAVIPDPIACIKEAERVLKTGGNIVVLDKFLPKNKKISYARRLLNLPANLFFTDITRSFETVIKATNLMVVADMGVHFNGNFRIIKLQK